MSPPQRTSSRLLRLVALLVGPIALLPGGGTGYTGLAMEAGVGFDAGLDPEFSEKFLRFVIDEVIHHHERIAERNAADC